MDTDPLADVGPPRYAVESDDEDEYNPLSPTRPPPKHDLDFEFINTGKVTAKTLVFASLEAGRIWAKGASLGEQLGTVAINKKCVGMIFNPGWADAIVIVSEALTRLPVWAQYPYAKYVLDQFKPTKLLLLDSYAASSYIQPKYVPLHKAPVRYIALESNTSIPKYFEPFSPPNLIQSTSAAFFSLISLSRQSSPQSSAEVVLFLFPGPYHPANPPDDLTSTASILTENDNLWPHELTKSVQEVLSGGTHKWNSKGGERGSSSSREKPRPRDEGNMYL
ncbi:hypothetical protein BJ322DRAFT_1018988 [Thelephora terrestris]|uniref:Proteasome assembly chaperone 1 n=1 Tax=Thelephora terrestris TaxID=56493 RepID=A0A9P6L9I3_9AGAM|nr:hypothetical protein BJ322DRAFT_1018988 [Thelephora terrestris]